MRDRRGFSLVEVLAALLILTVVITSSLLAFLERNRRLQQASEILLAYQALANEAEYQRRQSYLAAGTGPTFLGGTAVLAPLTPYETEVKFDLVQPGVKNVTLTIRWRNREREAKLGIVRVETGSNPLW
jgi:prepilin-type N-terminal cleavage/methylation domain-containing protein